MTLCAAAISRRDLRVITVSDLMLSTPSVSVDTSSVKSEPISKSGRWMAMFAGSPSVWTKVFHRAGGLIASGGETFSEVESAFLLAFREELKLKIEGEILGPFGIDRETFLKKGREFFGDIEFSRLLAQISAAGLETDFLVAGFEPNGWPRIFSVSDPGVSEVHSNLGFSAIGSGSPRAFNSLCSTYDPGLSTVDLVYRMCEAKFLGESAYGVGKNTFVIVIAPNGNQQRLRPEHVETIRPIWEKQGIPPVPIEAFGAISLNLQEMNWAKRPTPAPT
jgi:hypothetical protein